MHGDLHTYVHYTSCFIDPVLTLVPEVAAIIPGQDELTLTCTSNSDRHQVEWYSDPSSMPLSSESTLQVQLPTDILEYTCSVSDGTNILISAVVPLRNVEGNCVYVRTV